MEIMIVIVIMIMIVIIIMIMMVMMMMMRRTTVFVVHLAPVFHRLSKDLRWGNIKLSAFAVVSSWLSAEQTDTTRVLQN
eukprot:5790867-Amphidinium_carterae.1